MKQNEMKTKDIKSKFPRHHAFCNPHGVIALLVLFAGTFITFLATANQSAPAPHTGTEVLRTTVTATPSSTPTEAWVARYAEGAAGSNSDRESIAVDGSGNVYVTGHNGTVKYNSAGQEQWQAYGPVDAAMAVDASGNVYVTGYVRSQNDNDYLTIKYNSGGQEQWEATYNSAPGLSDDQPHAIAVDASGNVYVTGLSSTNAQYFYSYDYLTIKYNSAGQEQWVARYNGPGNRNDFAYAIAVDNLGNCYVTGESDGGSSFSDYATIKYNSAGQEQWVARYDGPASYVDEAWAIALDALGNVYVTGNSSGLGNAGDDYATIKYNSAGQQQWVARYNGPASWWDDAKAIAVDNSGNVYVTGSSMTANDGPTDYATVKYNSSGQQQWVARYNGPGNDNDDATAIAVDGSGNVYVTGSSTGQGSGLDYATIKYNSTGQQQWVARYNGPGNGDDQAGAIALDALGNVYVTGSSYVDLSNGAYATIKYVQGAPPTPTPTPTGTPTATPTATATVTPSLTPWPRPTPPPHITPVPPPPSPRPTAWPRPTPPPHLTPVPSPTSPRPTPAPRP
jgi:uncharacterized delta-60 repeat protein